MRRKYRVLNMLDEFPTILAISVAPQAQVAQS